MEVSLAVVADYASISQEGKLNIMGVFQEINPPAFPFPLPQMFLVVVMEAGVAESNSQKHIQILFLDEDGNQMIDIKSEAVIPQIASPTRVAYTNSVIGLNGLTFGQSGDYAFHILINGEEKRVVPLRINEPPAAIGGQDG